MFIPYSTDYAFVLFTKLAKGTFSVNYSTLRLRRADDDFEKEFDPLSGRVLDVDSITNFHSWNLLNGAEYKDYLYDSPLGVDSNDDGVSDGGWIKVGAEHVYTVENNKQILTANNVTGTFLGIKWESVSASEGESISEKVDYKLENVSNMEVEIRVRWVDAVDATISYSIGDTTDVDGEGTLTVTATAPATTATAEFYINFQSKGGNGSGILSVSNAVLVKNSFIEDIGLLTQDDDSDGVANEWTYTGNGFDGTVVKSVDSTNGQKLEITVGGTNSNDPFVGGSYNALTGDKYIFSVEVRVSGDVRALLFLGETGGGNVLVSTTSTEWVTLKTSELTLSTDTTIEPKLRIDPNGIGNTGYVEYRNATLKQTNNSVYVTEIQDATGNGNHATQSTASDQPRLVNAGVFEVDSDGNNSIYYDGIDDNFDVTDNAGLDITSGGLSFVVKYDPDAQTGYIFSKNLAFATDHQYAYAFLHTSNGFDQYLNGATIGNRDDDITNASRVNVGTYDEVNAKVYLDSVLKDTNAFTDVLTSRPNIQIACRSNSVDGLTKAAFYKGHISEIAIFDKALTQSQVTTLTNRL